MVDDFDEIWHKCNFRKNDTYFFFLLGNRRQKIENPLKGMVYFVKYLGNYRRYNFYVK